MTEILERMPPQANEAEQATLGSMLLEYDACAWAAENLRADLFYAPVHRHLFDAILDVWRTHDGSVDLVTVTDLLASRGQLERLGGTSYLIALQSRAPTAASIARYGDIVRDKARLRAAMEQCRQDARDILEAGDTLPDTLIERIHQGWEALAADTRVPDAKRLDAVLEEFWKDAETRENAAAAEFLPTGLADLDRAIGGLARGSVHVLAARPREGKTTVCLNWLCHQAIRCQQPVLLFSLEMNARALAGKVLAAEGPCNAFALRQGHLTPETWHRLGITRGEIGGAPLYIDDTRSLRLEELLRRTRRRVRTLGIRLVAIDYLQIVQAPGRDRRLQVDAVMYALQALAGELDLPILLLCQRSRPEGGDDYRRPKLADLKESGGIEECADMVIFIYHPRPKENGGEPKPKRYGAGVKELHVAKNRLGPMAGTVYVYWHPQQQRFYNTTQAQRDAAGVKAEEQERDDDDDQ